jgi:Rps23 Pro-64 3,4-dihydroxylase Tpa1-like proline 4-hydroxylase
MIMSLSGESPKGRTVRFHASRNDATRIDMFDELSHTALSALRVFCRRLGAPHLVDEVILPTLQDGDARIFAAVRDRPWPPWGLGARHISALCQLQAVNDESYALSPVWVADEDLTNVGLVAAVYKEVLEAVAASPVAEINYLVAEGSTLAHHVLAAQGFRRYDDVFLTEAARYFTYRVSAAELLRRLGLADLDTPDLLAHELPPDVLEKNALFQQTILLGSKAEWMGWSAAAEIIRLVRGGHAGKPGGVPGGTNRWGWVERESDWVFATLENFLGDTRGRLLDFALSQEAQFRPATIMERTDPAVNERLRRAKTLDALGPFERLFADKLSEVLSPVVARLKRSAFPVGRIEMQVTASGDGDFFRMHRDGGDDSTREISFVYFFHREPRRFSGGELRIFEAERIEGRYVPTDRSQTLSPRQDVIVFFDSRNEHEILPVRVPSRAFGDSRFTLNGWIHRAA